MKQNEKLFIVKMWQSNEKHVESLWQSYQTKCISRSVRNAERIACVGLECMLRRVANEFRVTRMDRFHAWKFAGAAKKNRRIANTFICSLRAGRPVSRVGSHLPTNARAVDNLSFICTHESCEGDEKLGFVFGKQPISRVTLSQDTVKLAIPIPIFVLGLSMNFLLFADVLRSLILLY